MTRIRKHVKRTVLWTMVVANVPVLLFLLLSAYSDRINPASYPTLAISGLFFPVALAATVVLLAVWLLLYWRGTLLPIAALLLSLPAIHRYMPLSRSQEIPDGAIKVMTYNVLMFAPWELDDKKQNPIVDYILEQDADIVCLQESSPVEAGDKWVMERLATGYPYHRTLKTAGGEWMTTYSKFPILSTENITLSSANSLAMACVLDVSGEEVAVVNCHLQSVGLSIEEKGDFRRMVENQMNDDEAKTATRSLLRKLRSATVTRAVEAREIAAAVAHHREKGRSIILCGDFNDSPISYTHRTIADGLTDCYVATGNGPGYTYQQNGMHVRIDNILCSNDWIPAAAIVDKKVDTSDHFPMVCWLKNNQKSKK